MRVYFKGEAMSLSSRDDPRVGFVVLYRNMMGRGDSVASDILNEFRDKEPVQVIEVQGKPYAWIYETLGLHYFDKNVGEIVGDDEVGQTVLINKDSWSAIEIGMATFSSRANNRDIILRVKESFKSTEVLREVRVNASRFIDGEYYEFEFEAIEDSGDRDFYVSISSPDSVAGNAITVRYVDRDILGGEMFLREKARPEFDLAYRIK